MIIVEEVVETLMMLKVTNNVLRGQIIDDKSWLGKTRRHLGTIRDVLNLHGLLHNLLALQQGIQSHLVGSNRSIDISLNAVRKNYCAEDLPLVNIQLRSNEMAPLLDKYY